MIAQLGRLLRMRLESLLDVIIREFLKAIVIGGGGGGAGQRQIERDDKCEDGLHAGNGSERRDNDKQNNGAGTPSCRGDAAAVSPTGTGACRLQRLILVAAREIRDAVIL